MVGSKEGRERGLGKGVIRSKGFIWLATRPVFMGVSSRKKVA
jgi:hypothetical protein